MPPRNEDNEAIEYFESLEDEQEQLNQVLRRFHDQSSDLAATEQELAELLVPLLSPFKSIYQRIVKHTAFRSAIYSIFADPKDVDLLKYEREFEDS